MKYALALVVQALLLSTAVEAAAGGKLFTSQTLTTKGIGTYEGITGYIILRWLYNRPGENQCRPEKFPDAIQIELWNSKAGMPRIADGFYNFNSRSPDFDSAKGTELRRSELLRETCGPTRLRIRRMRDGGLQVLDENGNLKTTIQIGCCQIADVSANPVFEFRVDL
jgi:hypothetical protein